ncbi:MAG: prolyl aminopeptidase [Alphaproteobacteria bacterium]|nr:prolyl aminopeptidase [Alphaproteobacteria bacterium]
MADYPELFTPIEPYESGVLAVDGRHTLYWEQCGRRDGVPAVFLHGGPGSGSSPTHRRFFDASHYRIVVFDQRGAGRSTPLGETTDNTTAHLVADIEALRRHLGIERWLVFGGSWGSTLALAYAQAHPARCIGLVLRGIFLGHRSEIDWFLDGIRTVFPENWRRFAEYLPADERHDLLRHYHRRLIDPDPAIHMPAARSWGRYEGSCSTLLPNPELVQSFLDDVRALGIARIEAHYFINDLFMTEDQLLRGVSEIRHLPASIIQGRYDMVCPLMTADRLAQAWPEARYRVIEDSGHSALELGIRQALVDATNDFKRWR